MNNNIIEKSISMLLLGAIIFFPGCDKQDKWLDAKPNKSTVIPETLADFQAVLEYTGALGFYNTAGLVGTDNLYLTDINYLASDEDTRKLYSWSKDLAENTNYWGTSYRNIQYANIVLDGLKKLPDNGGEYQNIMGQALFLRSISYYNLAALFCKAYSSTAQTDFGLPLRLNSDVNEISHRASLAQTYLMMLNDAIAASTLLANEQLYLNRPVKAAAFALLSKIYLNMRDYEKAKDYAGKCLSLKPDLLDFNNTNIVKINTEYRFPVLGRNHPEILFYAEGGTTVTMPTSANPAIVSPELYASYADGDLRKQVFYALSGTDVKFRGAYTGNYQNFCGLASNEIYLIRSECYARIGDVNAALTDLNYLLMNRYRTGEYVPVNAQNPELLLDAILAERRKELPFVGNQRWEDLKRLNTETRYQKTLTRTINNVQYSLPPNDRRFLLTIPMQEIQFSNIQQNER